MFNISAIILVSDDVHVIFIKSVSVRSAKLQYEQIFPSGCCCLCMQFVRARDREVAQMLLHH